MAWGAACLFFSLAEVTEKNYMENPEQIGRWHINPTIGSLINQTSMIDLSSAPTSETYNGL